MKTGEKIASLRTTLETGIPVLRNKNAGHEQGGTVTPISDEFVEFALNLASTNIVLLVGHIGGMCIECKRLWRCAQVKIKNEE